jgi:hypothetical protein
VRIVSEKKNNGKNPLREMLSGKILSKISSWKDSLRKITGRILSERSCLKHPLRKPYITGRILLQIIFEGSSENLLEGSSQKFYRQGPVRNSFGWILSEILLEGSSQKF